jgi:hypothetical protein
VIVIYRFNWKWEEGMDDKLLRRELKAERMEEWNNGRLEYLMISITLPHLLGIREGGSLPRDLKFNHIFILKSRSWQLQYSTIPLPQYNVIPSFPHSLLISN